MGVVAQSLFSAFGVALAGMGVFFIFLRPALLAEDLRFLGRSASEIGQSVPRLASWLRLVFAVLGGQAVAAGGLVAFVAVTAVQSNQWAVADALALVIAGAVSIGIMVVVNFIIGSAFRWVLLGIAGLLAAAITAAALS